MFGTATYRELNKLGWGMLKGAGAGLGFTGKTGLKTAWWGMNNPLGRIATGALAGGVIGGVAGPGGLKWQDRAILGAMAGAGAGLGFNAAWSRTARLSAPFKSARTQYALSRKSMRGRYAASVEALEAGYNKGLKDPVIGSMFRKGSQAKSHIQQSAQAAKAKYAAARESDIGFLRSLTQGADVGITTAAAPVSNLSRATLDTGIALGTAAGIGAVGLGSMSIAGDIGRNRRTARFQNSVDGLVQGMHAGRHRG